jgi:hypothetical protein
LEVKSFWSRRRSLDLEAELRQNRPEPRSEFVASLAEHVRSDHRPARGGLRVALAGVVTIALLAALAPVGALGSATSAARGIANVAARVVGTQSSPTAPKSTAAQDQYRPKKCPTGTKKKGKRCVKVKKKAKGARVSRRGPRFTG